METLETLEFNRLIQQHTNLVNPLNTRIIEDERLREDLMGNVCEEKYNDCIQCLEKLGDSAKHLYNLIGKQRNVNDDVLVLNLKAEVEWDVWSKSQKAIFNKVAFENINYSEKEKGYLSKLENVLISMSLENYELLILLKYKSNQEFHGGIQQSLRDAQKELDNTSFHGIMVFFKNPLYQLFRSLEIYESPNH
ncbi:hypothetical protein GLOIN_2v1776374 [Rhizophagus irregularis DAOM 181602=DAOM 197198]|uniref:Uncharacterized protein n=3 Tax=Rhizophagus irregularis TaxID=588596 RepID=A0A015JRQ1_RHIIW|nr:hypothetical protein GLOIN_2v1776374 [Rhizophagus irregularis DAOM 181602=DAOM 197198]EXX57714.1 hypothetical protein RirG_204640 [Rhizophagus irregularis DAOM 197198w]POG69974.1 hypothetical protein GLOIN_2v1776374 [Rhizophagus irregularis DAOM 181602=DAOM 197198]GBC48553.2 hypothetical protein GLOIN_2v1776374 [Rhizophagus irregularis DAOM 181602=DAOM 197198]|eukprot:XP_025176840.1 hypothetical protein GLOIN_2v1776374 [Rhizophagus irregularis DAOM 181602=DAOM 197198]